MGLQNLGRTFKKNIYKEYNRSYAKSDESTKDYEYAYSQSSIIDHHLP